MDPERDAPVTAVIAALSTTIATWDALATAPPRLRRKRLLEQAVAASPRVLSLAHLMPTGPSARRIPPQLTPRQRIGAGISGIMAVGNILRMWHVVRPRHAERQRQLREWREQRARYRRLRHGWEPTNLAGKLQLLWQLGRWPKEPSSPRWLAVSASVAVAGVAAYYDQGPRTAFQQRWPRYPSAAVSGLTLLMQVLRAAGIFPSALWVPGNLRLAGRTLAMMIVTLISLWAGWQAFRQAILSPEQIQRRYEEFQRQTEQRRQRKGRA